MRNVLHGCIAGLTLMLVVGLVQAAQGILKDDHPQQYRVRQGDNLWSIGGLFLENPWQWPQIWHNNPDIENPHLIFPGDTVSLINIDGQQRLTITARGDASRTIKLSPKVRSTPLDSAIPAIPLEKINSFLRNNRILEVGKELETAPYVIATHQDQVISGTGDQIYARGEFKNGYEDAYGIYRRGDPVFDPDSGEVLGVIAQEIGAVKVRKITGDIATLKVTGSREEIRIGDRLLPSEERRLAPVFYPKEPEAVVSGRILGVDSGVTSIGKFNNVLINLGVRDGMKEGDVLAIYRQLKIVDKIRKEEIRLPAERVGLLMVYRPFDKISYAIVMEAQQPLKIGDMIKNP
ncbi:LysM peptidoglycan-binding domain-containing protein [Endozoicomonadaceae bacterium StTr2]